LGARTEQRVALLHELLRTAAVPAANGDPALVGAGMPDLEQVPGWQRPGSPLSGQSTLAVLPGDPMSALLHLRAAGLWV
jgi:hypothetical protein